MMKKQTTIKIFNFISLALLYGTTLTFLWCFHDAVVYGNWVVTLDFNSYNEGIAEVILGIVTFIFGTIYVIRQLLFNLKD